MKEIIIDRENNVFPFELILNPEKSSIPYLPEVIVSSEEIPGLNGALPTESHYAPKSHTLTLVSKPYVSRDDKYAFREHMRNFIVQIKDNDCKLHYENLKRMFYVRFSGLSEISRDYATWIEFRVNLMSYHPYMYRNRETILSEPTMAVNKGNIPTPARLEFDGPATRPYIIINEQRHEYNGSISDGYRLIIDSKDYTARVVKLIDGSHTDVTLQWRGDFPVLSSGVTLINDKYGTRETSRIVWTDRWI